jgi:hypothetical protein
MPPCPVTFGEAVQKDQHRRIDRSLIDNVEFNPIGERNAFLFHHPILPASARVCQHHFWQWHSLSGKVWKIRPHQTGARGRPNFQTL